MARLTDEKHAKTQPDSKEAHNRAKFSKWLLGPVLAAGVGMAGITCTVDNYVPQNNNAGGNGAVDGGTTSDGGTTQDGGADAGCTAPAPVCVSQTVSAVLGAGEPLLVGDFRILLVGTDESGGEQRAIVDLLDSCDAAIVSHQAVNEGESEVFNPAAQITLEVKAENVTVTEAKARITATMGCETIDAGPVEDGGVGEDGGANDAGPDADAGPDIDGGGLDAGVDEDAGALDGGEDAGPADGGGGFDAGPMEDGGVEDGGAIVCAEAATGVFSGLIFTGTPQAVGGYVFDYLGPNPSGDALMSITCGGAAVATAYAFPEDVATPLEVTADGKRIIVTPHSLDATKTNIHISVANL